MESHSSVPVPQEAVSRKARRRISTLKKLAFALLTAAIFFAILEGLLALAGVEPVVLTEDPFLGFSKTERLFVEKKEPDGTVFLRTAANKQKIFCQQRFPKRKGPRTYRIFCLGGSTTAGRPFDEETSFCGWLRVFLPKADPSRDWEVINAGGLSYASYRVTALMEELARYEPDCFIVYSGHNEFLEARTYGDLAKMSEIAMRSSALIFQTRTYAFLRSFSGQGSQEAEGVEKRFALQAEVNERLNHTIGPTAYHRDDLQRDKIILHYRLNLERMINLAQAAKAKLVLVVPAANLKDMSPFKSEHGDGLSTEDKERWEAHYTQGQARLQDGDPDGALNAFEEALALDARHAELHFRMGKAYFEKKAFAQARTSFLRAIEEDIVPLRILPSMQDVVREIAERRGVPGLDFAKWIDTACAGQYGHAVPGKEFFVDHVHLSIEGYRLLALELLKVLVEAGVAMPQDSWNPEAVAEVTKAVKAKIDREANGYHLWNLGKTMYWAGKHEEALHAFEQARLNLLGSAEAPYMPGEKKAGEVDAEELRDYRSLLENNLDYALADSYSALGKGDEALELFRGILKRNPEYARAHFGMARIMAGRGQYADAIGHYRSGLEIFPYDAKSQSQLGILLLDQGSAEEARTCFQEALKNEPSQPLAHFGMARCLVQNGEYVEAEALLQEALGVNPDDVPTHLLFAALLQKAGKLDKAEWHVREARRIEPAGRHSLPEIP